MIQTILRFNLAAAGAAGAAGPERTRLHRTMLDLCAEADAAGVGEVTFSEHHVTGNRSLTSPLLAAAAALARTERARVSVSALLLPLADPVRVAEDIATLDDAAPGRLRVVLALGYRPEEYARFGRPFEDRGALMDDSLARLLDAWRGGGGPAPAPTPQTSLRELVAVGGQTMRAARRAARFGLAFAPRTYLPELRDRYEAICVEGGVEPRCWMPAARFHQVHLSEDPERTWSVVGERYLEDTVEYARWQTAGPRSPVFSGAASVADLRHSGAVQIVTPAQCRDLVADSTDAALCLHPLAGGMPDEEARRCVRLFATEVLPHLPPRGDET